MRVMSAKARLYCSGSNTRFPARDRQAVVNHNTIIMLLIVPAVALRTPRQSRNSSESDFTDIERIDLRVNLGYRIVIAYPVTEALRWICRLRLVSNIRMEAVLGATLQSPQRPVNQRGNRRVCLVCRCALHICNTGVEHR